MTFNIQLWQRQVQQAVSITKHDSSPSRTTTAAVIEARSVSVTVTENHPSHIPRTDINSLKGFKWESIAPQPLSNDDPPPYRWQHISQRCAKANDLKDLLLHRIRWQNVYPQALHNTPPSTWAADSISTKPALIFTTAALLVAWK